MPELSNIVIDPKGKLYSIISYGKAKDVGIYPIKGVRGQQFPKNNLIMLTFIYQ